MNPIRARLWGACAALLFALMPAALSTASAQTSWPQRNVRFIVPLGPGSGADIGARLFADRLTARWGKPVVVENRPGGDGIVAISAFVSAHDDHTLLFSPAATFTAHPYLHDKLPYEQADLLPIARVSNTLVVIAAPASLKVESLADLMALVRAQPGKLNWATATGISDFLFASFLKNSGLEMSKVPYRDPVQPATDVGEGRIQFYWGALAIVRPHVQAGRAKLLAVSNGVRIPDEPTVPTVREAGFPALAYDGLVGLFGPRDMADDLRERIAADVREVAGDPAIAARLLATGQLISPGRPAEFAASIDEQRAVVAKIAKEMGIKPGQQVQ
ncbi:MAG TPA: tripartite tricarboxylate transporter substrate binding protein [Xanthobacteraceae bacterium]|nr:tripartite tricarboxylate transporter substrate binding protein [Xanthobacteraceae bacterium]